MTCLPRGPLVERVSSSYFPGHCKLAATRRTIRNSPTSGQGSPQAVRTVPVERPCRPSAEHCDLSRPGAGAGLHLGRRSHRDSAVPVSSRIADAPEHGASGMFRDVCKCYPFTDRKFRQRRTSSFYISKNNVAKCLCCCLYVWDRQTSWHML